MGGAALQKTKIRITPDGEVVGTEEIRQITVAKRNYKEEEGVLRALRRTKGTIVDLRELNRDHFLRPDTAALFKLVGFAKIDEL